MQSSAAEGLVVLAGRPEEAGATYGRVTAARNRGYVADFLAAADAAGVGWDTLRRRTDRYRAMVDVLAPAWHAELAAIAGAADLPVERYTAYVAQKYVVRVPRPPARAPEHECTSFVAVGRATAGGELLLHKNRDSFPRAQGLWLQAVEGCHRYLGGGDVGDHGVIHFVNEHGLAGSMNAGSPNEDRQDEGLPTPQILRLIAERAATCAEALEILRDVVERGWYTNGVNGSLWFFVDPRRGLVVENTRRQLDCARIEDGVCVRANDFMLPHLRPWARPDAALNPRYLAALAGVRTHAGRLTPAHLNHLSRDVSTDPERICGDSTLSGFTAAVTPRRPSLLSHAWAALGRPSHSLYLPCYVGARGVPAALVDGTLWQLAARRHADRPSGPPPVLEQGRFETDLDGERLCVEGEVEALAAAGQAAAAADRLTEAVADWTRRAAAALGGRTSGAAVDVPPASA